jgi:hypothetical protein
MHDNVVTKYYFLKMEARRSLQHFYYKTARRQVCLVNSLSIPLCGKVKPLTSLKKWLWFSLNKMMGQGKNEHGCH